MNAKNITLYGQKGVPWFGKTLKEEDYDVFICDIDDCETDITDLEDKDHFNTVDTCIMWGALQIMNDKLHDGMCIIIQSPEADVVKKYTTLDTLLKDLWKTLTDVPMDPETEELEVGWFIFPEGTNREEIWLWFDEHISSGGVASLMGC